MGGEDEAVCVSRNGPLNFGINGNVIILISNDFNFQVVSEAPTKEGQDQEQMETLSAALTEFKKEMDKVCTKA